MTRRSSSDTPVEEQGHRGQSTSLESSASFRPLKPVGVRDEARDEQSRLTLRALRHLAWVFACLAALQAPTYFVPALARLRPWAPGDPIPLARLADSWRDDLALPRFAGAAGYSQQPSLEQADGALGESLAQVLAEQERRLVEEERESTSRSSDSGPAHSRTGSSSASGLQGVGSRTVSGTFSKVGGKGSQNERPGANPEDSRGGAPSFVGPPSPEVMHELGGDSYAATRPSTYSESADPVSLQDPTGSALRAFFLRLQQTANRLPHAKTRIAYYGDSSIAADHITSTLRRRLQKRFGDGGHGFVLIARGGMAYRHLGLEHRANNHWLLYPVTRKARRDGRYGYGGVMYRASPGARARFGTTDEGAVGHRAGEFAIYYQAHARGGRLGLNLDGKPLEELDTRNEVTEDKVHRIRPGDDGAHRLELRYRGGGDLRLYGVAMETQAPGLVLDSLGLVGARAKRLLNFDADHIAGQMRFRRPSLVVLAFGGNEAGDGPSSVERVQSVYTRVIRRMRRGASEASCLVLAPLDQARRDDRGRVQTMPAVPIIVEGQKRAAIAEGCAFFNTFSAMGGNGSMAKWLRARPQLASSDLRHATPLGYEVIGTLVYKALMAAFQKHLH